MKFREFLNQNEAKQVGVVYYFVDYDAFKAIISGEKAQPNTLFSWNGHISFTRNFNLPRSGGYDNAFANRAVRIQLNGDKISEKYSINPILGRADDEKDLKNAYPFQRVSRHSGEAEEVILNVGNFTQGFKLKDLVI